MRFMVKLCLILIVAGGTLVYLGVQEVRLSTVAKKTPQLISCEALGENGPGENAHVLMNEFLLCDFAYVYEENSNGRMTKVWVPAVPVNGPFHQKLLSQVNDAGVFVGEMPLPKEIKVIVKSNRVHSEGQLGYLAEGETIQGLIVNKIENLDSKERRLLEMNYPNVDFNQCYILDHGRRIANPRTTLALLIGGGMLIAAGGIVLLAGRKVM